MANGMPSIKVEIIDTQGSTPRGVGASIFVSKTQQSGTIGGGSLEWNAIAHARRLLDGATEAKNTIVALGPKINQCCGGQVTLSYTQTEWPTESHDQSEKQSIYIFGAGHTGAAIAKQFLLLNWSVHLIDEREEWLEPFASIENINLHHEALPEAIINTASRASVFIVTTHSHGLDFAISAAALKREDATYIGMIGSKTKREKFCRWAELERHSFSDAHFHCPMGEKFEGGKAPETIALNVAHQVVGEILNNSKEKQDG